MRRIARVLVSPEFILALATEGGSRAASVSPGIPEGSRIAGVWADGGVITLLVEHESLALVDECAQAPALNVTFRVDRG